MSLNKNSWVLSIIDKESMKHNHHFFCTCSREFMIKTSVDELYTPYILCPACGNDYFKDVDEFVNIRGTKIWKYFECEVVAQENELSWNIVLKYQIPIYDELTKKAVLKDQDLLSISLNKEGDTSSEILYTSKLISQYSLFLDDKIQPFKDLLSNKAKESLYQFIINNRTKRIGWISVSDIQEFSLDEKLNYLTYFLSNPNLKEHRFFFWKMKLLHRHTRLYTTQMEMLNFLANSRKEKSLKKALYKTYESSINTIGYYPYSDYVFSRTIDDVNLLIKVYEIYPAIKEHIFTDETFSVAIVFIGFLKRHYTQMQIVRLFTQEMQNPHDYKKVLQNWRDTLRMLQSRNAIETLEQHFVKVKLTSKKLHDEILRVFHIASYELDSKENFEYDEKYLAACNRYKELEFKLPQTVKELSLWSQMLHNCMFGYSRRIHEHSSIIYGVFKENELKYAVELHGFNIVQAKAVFNGMVGSEDMEKINSWKSNHLLAS